MPDLPHVLSKHHLPHRVMETAHRLNRRMKELGFSQIELERRCAAVMDANLETANLTQNRLSKILMNRRASPSTSAAKIVSNAEIIVLSRALDVAPEWLSAQTVGGSPVLWDALSDELPAAHLLHLLADGETRAGQLVMWSEGLTCSLVPPAFAHKYYEAYFSELDELIKHADGKKRLITLYDGIAAARRKRLICARRNARFEQIVSLGELYAVRDGTGRYARIPSTERRNALRVIGDLVTDDNRNVNLTIVDDTVAADALRPLRGFERVICAGKDFSLWSHHYGKIAWSENPAVVARHTEMLMRLEEYAKHKTAAGVANLLTALAESINHSSGTT